MKENLREFRRRQSQRGYKRVEVSVSAEDAALVRRVANALTEGGQVAETLRHALEKSVPAKRSISYKEWLSELPED